MPRQSASRSVIEMSYVHCDQCRRAFNFSGGASSQGCPRCAGNKVAVTSVALPSQQQPATLGELALAMATALNTATAAELIEAQLLMRDAAPAARTAPDLGNRAIIEALAHARHGRKHVAVVVPGASLASWTRAIVIATIEAATLRLIAQVEQARNARPGNRFANVVDLFPAAGRLDAAKRWVAKLAA